LLWRRFLVTHRGYRTATTGGDSGIGAAVAIAFARAGADVAINYLPEEQVDADAIPPSAC